MLWLFVDIFFVFGLLLIDGLVVYYFGGVMWLKIGDLVKLFDDCSGEWFGVVVSVGKCDLVLNVIECLCLCEDVFDFWFCVVLIKKGWVDWLVEKVCEFGVVWLVLVVMCWMIVDKFNIDCLCIYMIEVVE